MKRFFEMLLTVSKISIVLFIFLTTEYSQGQIGSVIWEENFDDLFGGDFSDSSEKENLKQLGFKSNSRLKLKKYFPDIKIIINFEAPSENDTLIKIKVDPEKWAKSSIEKRWYVLYHELGHDVLNLDHGQGGKMMFNFVDRNYTWDEFFNDKQYMFNFLNK